MVTSAEAVTSAGGVWAAVESGTVINACKQDSGSTAAGDGHLRIVEVSLVLIRRARQELEKGIEAAVERAA